MLASRDRLLTRSSALGDDQIDLTASSIPLELVTSLATGPPLPTPAVIQPNLELYVNTVDPTHMNASADNVDAAMLTLKLTHLPEAEGGERTVLGVSFAHIMGDGASFCVFMRTLGRLYEGETIAEHEWWNWGPHVDLIEEPSEEMLAKWEHPLLWPTYDLRTAFGMCESAPLSFAPSTLLTSSTRCADCAGADGDLVQWTLTPDEISLLKTLATGAGHSGWVSEQDAISSYWLNILNLCGENITSTMNTINVRSLIYGAIETELTYILSGLSSAPSSPPTLTSPPPSPASAPTWPNSGINHYPHTTPPTSLSSPTPAPSAKACARFAPTPTRRESGSAAEGIEWDRRRIGESRKVWLCARGIA